MKIEGRECVVQVIWVMGKVLVERLRRSEGQDNELVCGLHTALWALPRVLGDPSLTDEVLQWSRSGWSSYGNGSGLELTPEDEQMFRGFGEINPNTVKQLRDFVWNIMAGLGECEERIM